MNAALKEAAAKAAARELVRRRAAREHLLDFTGYTMPAYKPAEFHRHLAAKLEAVERGEIKRLLVMAPPRHGKTELTSRRFPAWYLGRHPDRDVISASYGSELAIDFSRDVRSIIAGQQFRALFPVVELAADAKSADRWYTNQGGGFVAAGVGTPITGRGADLLNIDDPVKSRAEAESELARRNTWAWYRSVAYTRLQPGAAVVLTLTRWHEEDLAGMLINAEADGGEKWEKVVFPAIDPTSGKALWPEAYPKEVLRQIERTVGPYEWSSLYLQQPRPPGGSFFSECDLLVSGMPVAVPNRSACVFAVIDTATKTGSRHDGCAAAFFALQPHVLWGIEGIPPPLVVLDWEYQQIEGALLERWLPTVFQRLEYFARQCQAIHGSIGCYVEDKSSGMVLLQQAQSRNWPAISIDSKLTAMGKSERAIDASPYVSRGWVKLSEPAYQRVVTFKGVSRNHLLHQVLSFRAGTADMGADDLLDCFTYACALALGNPEGF